MGRPIRNPTPEDCYRMLKSFWIIIIPLSLAGIILIVLLAYEMRYEESLTDEQKKNIFYGELFLSFFVSFMLLLTALFNILHISYLKNVTSFLYKWGHMILFGFTTPFIILIIRAFIKDKTYKQYASGLTILSTIISMVYNLTFLTLGACTNIL
jgi:uncharacterized membrane protein